MAIPLVLLILKFCGWFLFVGLLTPTVDPVQAAHGKKLQILRPKAEAGAAGAQYQIGIIYRDGLAGAVNPAAAAKWLERAAGQGHAAALVAPGGFIRPDRGTLELWAGGAILLHRIIALPQSAAPTQKRNLPWAFLF